jgi:hypothetical protein
VSNLPNDYAQAIVAEYPFVYPNDLTLRDYFAAAALPVVLKFWTDGDTTQYAGDVGRRCYMMADAMLEARKP